VRGLGRMLRPTKVNTRNCRKQEQAKGAGRLGPKGKWVVGCLSSRPTRAILPPADRVGLRYSLPDTRNVVTSCLRPLGRLTVRHADGGMGRDDGRSEGRPVMGWIRIESLEARHYPARKGADVRRVLRCEKVGRTILRGKANEATLCEPCALYLNGDWLPACIAKVIGSFDHRVTSTEVGL
jgi:hypothetical protein